jgi:hypothetical protein
MISDIGVDDVIKFEPLRFFSSIKSSIVQMSNVVFEKQKEEESITTSSNIESFLSHLTR